MRSINRERENPCRAENDFVEIVLADFKKTEAKGFKFINF